MVVHDQDVADHRQVAWVGELARSLPLGAELIERLTVGAEGLGDDEVALERDLRGAIHVGDRAVSDDAGPVGDRKLPIGKDQRFVAACAEGQRAGEQQRMACPSRHPGRIARMSSWPRFSAQAPGVAPDSASASTGSADGAVPPRLAEGVDGFLEALEAPGLVGFVPLLGEPGEQVGPVLFDGDGQGPPRRPFRKRLDRRSFIWTRIRPRAVVTFRPAGSRTTSATVSRSRTDGRCSGCRRCR